MLMFYVLHDKVNEYAHIWYEGSIIQLLYPEANPKSQRISDLLKSLGKMESVETFFEAHIQWIKENICSDSAVVLDSTGMPNSIHFPLTAISNHNGKISIEVRMTTTVQKGFRISSVVSADTGHCE